MIPTARFKPTRPEGRICSRFKRYNQMSESIFNVLRMYSDDTPSKIVRRNLSEEEAKAHCRRPDTKGVTANGVKWFDGFTEAGKRNK